MINGETRCCRSPKKKPNKENCHRQQSLRHLFQYLYQLPYRYSVSTVQFSVVTLSTRDVSCIRSLPLWVTAPVWTGTVQYCKPCLAGSFIILTGLLLIIWNLQREKKRKWPHTSGLLISSFRTAWSVTRSSLKRTAICAGAVSFNQPSIMTSPVCNKNSNLSWLGQNQQISSPKRCHSRSSLLLSQARFATYICQTWNFGSQPKPRPPAWSAVTGTAELYLWELSDFLHPSWWCGWYCSCPERSYGYRDSV